MRNFLDQTGPLWMKGALIGKVGSVFASTGTQHGGQETTITSFHTTLLHHGMVIVGVPYSESGLMHMEEISGGTPYGATTLAGPSGARQPSENELKIARYQGKHVRKLRQTFPVILTIERGNLDPSGRKYAPIRRHAFVKLRVRAAATRCRPAPDTSLFYPCS